MNVRVCGPNLHHQEQGSFHVHADGCRDLGNYGPGGRQGGDMDGHNEMLVKDATIIGIVFAVYDNGILDEAAADAECSKWDMANSNAYVDDFRIFPCCGKLEHGNEADFS